MAWKDWSYWLKGGMIVSIISIMINIVLVLSISGERDSGLIFAIYNLPVMFLIDSVEGVFNYSNIVYPVIILISGIAWFIIGAIIGWIYGKIKGSK